jgi:copper chaperone NosL
MTTLNRRRLLCAACATSFVSLLAACGKEDAAVAQGPVDFDNTTACELDGMVLAEYGGPKAQVLYAGAAAPVFFCDTVELFSALLRPEQARAVRGAYVQDMGQADWDKPRGHWIDAKTGYYVIGSRKHGSMGPTIASFAQEADAQKFKDQYGGKVLRFAEVTADMTDLSGGAQQDMKM